MSKEIEDVVSVMRKAKEEIESLRQQLSELKGMREEVVHYQKEFHRVRDQLSDHIKREVMLRDALNYIALTYDSIWTKGMPIVCDVVDEALAATADLKGLRVCHAEPVATGLFDYFGECHAVEHNPKAAMGPGQLGRSKAPLYRAWEPK